MALRFVCDLNTADAEFAQFSMNDGRMQVRFLKLCSLLKPFTAIALSRVLTTILHLCRTSADAFSHEFLRGTRLEMMDWGSLEISEVLVRSHGGYFDGRMKIYDVIPR